MTTKLKVHGTITVSKLKYFPKFIEDGWDLRRVDEVVMPFNLSINSKTIKFNDYSAIVLNEDDTLNSETEEKIYTVPFNIVPEPRHYKRQDNSFNWYERLVWVGESHHEYGYKLTEFSIQTWDFITFFIDAEYPHKRFNYRGCDEEFFHEGVIVVLDDKSKDTLKDLFQKYATKPEDAETRNWYSD